jgi:hypothetical protein
MGSPGGGERRRQSVLEIIKVEEVPEGRVRFQPTITCGAWSASEAADFYYYLANVLALKRENQPTCTHVEFSSFQL